MSARIVNASPAADKYAVMDARPPTALLFPGQGSQTDDMRESVERFCPELLEQAIAELDVDPFEHLDEGTAFVQPALYCASLAGWASAGRPGAAFMAGHSLGELAALAAAGSLSEATGLSLAMARGRLMQEAAEAGPEGGMLAVLGSGDGALAVAKRFGLTVANDNAPGQVILSGPVEALDAAVPALKEAGLRAMRLRVQGPFHSPAIAPAVPAFRKALAEAEIEPPRASVISGTTALPFDDIRRRLADALTSPVRWRETLIHLHEQGVRTFIETGPGNVLTGLVRRTLDDVEATTVPTPEPAHA
jgi:[acyl-carrier-protein] S-malonyltransferase